MINFFRKIRQGLLTQNKFSKYILYAIGEIILVVIGILIALSINNWNHVQQDLAKEQKILMQLQREYQSNLAQLDEKILMRSNMVNAGLKVLHFIDNPQGVTKEELLEQIGHFRLDPTFDPISNDLISSGNLHLISSDELREKLSNWTSNVFQLQEMELEWQKIRTEIVIPFSIKIGLQRDLDNIVWKKGHTPSHALDKSMKVTHDIGPSAKMPSVQFILNGLELEGISAEALTWSELCNMQSGALRNHILEILTLIEQEIDTKS